MGKRGTEFGVDLYELKKAAKEDFPTVSNVYGDAIGNCERVYSQLDDVLRRPEHFGGDALGPVRRAYVELHDVAIRILRETRTNLDDSAVALNQAAEGYAETDAGAAAEMERMLHRDPPKPEA